MPDTYKDEFQANKDWLRLAFHAKQEFPDYPYVNATYQDVYDNFKTIEKEVERFAGPGMYADVLCTHWLPLSKDACKALVDCGIRLVSPSVGDKWEFDGDESKLPYGHAARLKQNRQPETMLFTRQTNDARILTGGTGYVTDVGMTGVYDSILGVKNECVLEKFLYKMPVRFEEPQGKIMFNGAVFDIDEKTSLCTDTYLVNFCE
jgi:hypothetical protein